MLLRSAWLYTRGSESVRIEVRDEETRFLLIVNGPGPEWSHQVCDEYAGALKAQLVHEADLKARGFALEGFEQWQPVRRTQTATQRSAAREDAVRPARPASDAQRGTT